MQARDVIILIIIVGCVIYFAFRYILFGRSQAVAGQSIAKQSSIPASRRRTDLEKLIESQGYEILQRTNRIPVEIQYGDKQIQSQYTADLVVEKDGLRFVVKKKRKAERSSLSSVSIRRELFPLTLLHDADGVLYVDTNSGKVKEITFLYARPFDENIGRSWKPKVFWFVFGLLIGIAIALTRQ